MRHAFEKHGTPLPVGEGLYLWLVAPYEHPPVLVDVSGKMFRLDGRSYLTEQQPPGLYIPLTRLLAAMDVADALCAWTAVSDDDPWADALTTYRSTR
jgi:hypothetical protein